MPIESTLKLQTNTTCKLMLFEMSCGGHYPEYIAHLIRYWCKAKLPGSLSIIVSTQFLKSHREVVDLVAEATDSRVSLIPITPAEAATLVTPDSGIKRAIRAVREFNLAQKYAASLQANHILFTYFDTRQLPLALSYKLPCTCSGIYFRPRFHYPQFLDYQQDWKEKLAQWKEKVLLSAALKHPQLRYIFSLDPYVVKYFEQFPTQAPIIPLVDPIEIDSSLKISKEELKASLGIESQRKVLLLFGGLTRRKGIVPLLEAISLLPSQKVRQLCLFLVGSINPECEKTIQNKIEAVTQLVPLQVVCNYRYVSETETQQYFQLADIVLALYQKHVGMSGILIRAAAAQKPVLSTDYGLMGEITRRYQLGLTVDSTNPQAIARGLSQLSETDTTKLIDQEKMQQFARQNSASNFARTIFQHLQTI